MARTYLEQLVAEWYEYQGFFVRSPVPVPSRGKRGPALELALVAYHPARQQVVHVETGLDAHSWEQRERRCREKFDAGAKVLPALFGAGPASRAERLVVLGLAGRTHDTLAGAKVVLAHELTGAIMEEFQRRRMRSRDVPDKFFILRTLQFITEYRRQVIQHLS